MSRPLRIEFPGAVYHVTSRGDRREAIYRDDDDRVRHLEVIAQGVDRFDARVLAYCLMGNHYHLVLRTGQPNLSALMRHINGVYTQIFNRRHALAGHLFQGRFKAILVDTDAYLMSLCRYVERNPVAAHLVRRATEWPWSSCRAHTGLAKAPEWLDVQALHAFVLGHAPRNAADVRQACRGYAALVDGDSGDDGISELWQAGLRQQIYLGDEAFVARMQARAETGRLQAAEIPSRQRRPPHAAGQTASYSQLLSQCHGDRAAAFCAGYRSGRSMTELAREAGVSVATVSRLIAAREREAQVRGR